MFVVFLRDLAYKEETVKIKVTPKRRPQALGLATNCVITVIPATIYKRFQSTNLTYRKKTLSPPSFSVLLYINQKTRDHKNLLIKTLEPTAGTLFGTVETHKIRCITFQEL